MSGAGQIYRVKMNASGFAGLIPPMAEPTLPASRRLAMMRRAYSLRGLAEADLAPTWSAMLARWLDDAETGGILEPNAMVVATADADGRPNARTVLLKGLDETALTFFTNYDSAKGRELGANPVAAVLFPWVELQRQVKLAGPVRRLDADASDAYFASRPYGSRLGALASPQSQVIADRAQLEAARDALAARYPRRRPAPGALGRVRRRARHRRVLAGPPGSPARPARLPATARAGLASPSGSRRRPGQRSRRAGADRRRRIAAACAASSHCTPAGVTSPPISGCWSRRRRWPRSARSTPTASASPR